MNGQIEQLTREQEALLSVYRAKWRKIALSTEKIDRIAAQEAIQAAYSFLGLEKPEIVFCDSPYIASIAVDTRARGLLNNNLLSEIRISSLKWDEHLWNKLLDIHSLVCSAIDEKLEDKWILIPEEFEAHYLQTDILSTEASSLDFYISELNYKPNLKQWEIYRSILENCGWICAYDNICFICDRPIQLSFDDRDRLHAQCEPAIQYADGFSVYAYEGGRLPKKYGTIHLNNWQAKWLLKEDDIAVRKVLVRGLDYTKIYQELQVFCFDYWKDYSLDLDLAIYDCN
jgi:hypothetical protein